jgi:ARG/rhodanese/phosphatase superfamily protein
MKTVAVIEDRDELALLLEGVAPGAPVDVEGAALVPLAGGGSGAEALLLAEALARGLAEVTEVGERGRVDRVQVRNRAGMPLLLLDGEEILGAKQNRVFNASFVVAAGAIAEVPVSCVERGRWSYRAAAPAFSSPQRTVVTSVRSAKVRRVTDSVVTRMDYDADQGSVWSDVERHLEHTGVHSATSAYADAAAAQAQRIERALARLAPAPGQRGVAMVRAGVLQTLDLFAGPQLFARAWPALARGLLAETAAPWSGWHDPVAVVRAALAAVAGAGRVRRDAPGGGQTLHGSAGGHAFGAVAAGGDGYHCVVVGE